MTTYRKGDEIKFRNGDEVLTGWVDSSQPVYDEQEYIVGYVVSCPEFQGIVRVDNIIEEDN
jgi:hypothetical protein